jgi:hypothetical protein
MSQSLRLLKANCFAALLLITSSLVAQIPSYVPTNGLVGYWPFNGNANDESGNGNHGTVNGAILTSDRNGNANSAYSFDGVSSNIQTANSTSLSFIGDHTISAWIYQELPITNYNSILFKRLGGNWSYNLSISNYLGGSGQEMNKVMAGRRNNDGAQTQYRFSNATTSFNIWQHILVVVKNDSLKFFINGQDAGFIVGYNGIEGYVPFGNTYTVSMIDQPIGITIGDCNCGGSEHMFGLIDDVAVYNRALTPTEITALYTGVTTIPGCTNTTACNYNAAATQDDGSCTFPAQTYLTCAGTCINDADNDGTCDELENPTLPSYLPSNGLVGYWPFNGNANDESGNGNHGTVNGATLTTDRNGNANSAYSFDGNGDYIHVTNNFFDNGSSGWSVSMWSKLDEIQNPNNGNSSHILFNTSPHNGTGISLNWGGSSKYAISLGNGAPATSWNTSIFNAQSIQDITTDSWKYVTLVKSGNGYSLYLDGIFDNSWIVNTSIVSYFYSMYFGACDPIASNEVLIGDIDDIAIYNRALTPAEITALYNGTTTGGGGTTGTPAPSVPQGIPYQAMIRDNNGAALVNTPVTVRFSLRQDAIDETVEYQETHNLTTNAFGLVNTHFGSGTATQGTFANINWSNTSKFIQVEANTGPGYVEMGTQQMMSVPFALKAIESNKVKNAGLPVYADNAAALAGGLVAGEMYRTATGDLKIVY